MKILFTQEISSSTKKILREMGVTVVFGKDRDVDAVVVTNKFDEISEFKNIKWIHSFSAGVDYIVPLLKDKNILLTNSSGVHPIPIAEHVFAMILSFERGLYHALRFQLEKKWERPDVTELNGKTIGIVGLGRIGSEIARLSKAFGCKVIAVKRGMTKERYVDILYTTKNLNSLLVQSDYVVICLPLTEETRHLIGAREFSKMKKGAVIINIGRGAVINEKNLVDALIKKRIAGAGLDVFDEEPLPKESKLWDMENVIITSHYSGHTPFYMKRAEEIFIENLKAYMNGKKMPNLVDIKSGY